jgi:hypothetical protein
MRVERGGVPMGASISDADSSMGTVLAGAGEAAARDWVSCSPTAERIVPRAA